MLNKKAVILLSLALAASGCVDPQEPEETELQNPAEHIGSPTTSENFTFVHSDYWSGALTTQTPLLVPNEIATARFEFPIKENFTALKIEANWDGDLQASIYPTSACQGLNHLQCLGYGTLLAAPLYSMTTPGSFSLTSNQVNQTGCGVDCSWSIALHGAPISTATNYEVAQSQWFIVPTPEEIQNFTALKSP